MRDERATNRHTQKILAIHEKIVANTPEEFPSEQKETALLHDGHCATLCSIVRKNKEAILAGKNIKIRTRGKGKDGQKVEQVVTLKSSVVKEDPLIRTLLI